MKYGVYQIRNLKNQKLYIGSSSYGGGLSYRWRKHQNLLRINKHHSIKLQRAWNKYGADAFVFEVLLYCDPGRCLINEQVFINDLEPAYNIAQVAGAPMKGRKHTQESKGRMGTNQSGSNNNMYGRRGKQSPLYGRHLSESTKLKISQSRLGKKYSEESRRKLRGSQTHRAKLNEIDVLKIKQLLSLGISQQEIASQFGVAKNTISNIRTGRSWGYLNV